MVNKRLPGDLEIGKNAERSESAGQESRSHRELLVTGFADRKTPFYEQWIMRSAAHPGHVLGGSTPHGTTPAAMASVSYGWVIVRARVRRSEAVARDVFL